MTVEVKSAGVLTMAGVLASQPFGIPMTQIALGTCFAIVGVIGRAAFEFQTMSEGSKGGIQLNKILGWIGAGFFGAPFITLAYLIILKLFNIQSDGLASLGLLFLGFSGSRAFTYLMQAASGLLSKKGVNIIPPSQNPPSDDKGA